jgi:hypothetical protein
MATTQSQTQEKSAADALKQKFADLVELLRAQKGEEASRLVAGDERLLHHVDGTKRYIFSIFNTFPNLNF